MTVQDSDSKHICFDCIGEEFLADEVNEKDIPAWCSYCGAAQEAITLDDLAERIRTALDDHCVLTPGQPCDGWDYYLYSEGRWERRGDPVEHVIAELTQVEIEIAEEVTEFLSDRYGDWIVREEGMENPYGPEAMYERSGPRNEKFHYAWLEFCREIQSGSRFFSTQAETLLKFIFGDIDTHETRSGRPVVREIGPDTDTPFVWRARLAETENELKEILKSLARQIGPPPSRTSRGGRMNARGISVFYGAFEKDTCIAEVRPPVGSKVVVAKFSLLRKLRLLDLDALAEVDDSGSCFDPGYAERRGRASFFKWLVSEISRPVMRDEEEFEHIATQAMSEYLANKVFPRLDGAIYRSTQVGGTSQNLVLFNHASRIDLQDPALENDVTVHLNDPFDDDVITIFEQEKSTTGSTGIFGYDETFDWIGDPSLRYEPDNVVVFEIAGAEYKYKTIEVSRVQLPGKSQGRDTGTVVDEEDLNQLFEDIIP